MLTRNVLGFILCIHNMSIFKFYTDKNLSVSLENHDDLRMLTYLMMCPNDLQKMVLGFAEKKIVKVKKANLQGGLKNPTVMWMNENAVVEANDYEIQSWPLYMCVVEQKDELLVTRNELLAPFFRDMKRVAKGNESYLIHTNHEFSARMYAYWLLKKRPETMEFVIDELVRLFGVSKDNYKSYTLFEKKIMFRVKDRLEGEGVRMDYRREPESYAKKMVVTMKLI